MLREASAVPTPRRADSGSARIARFTRRRGLVVDQDDEVFAAGLPQAMRAPGARQDRGTRRDVHGLAIQRHRAGAAEDVVDLVLLLLVQADARSRLERALAKHQPQLRHLAEERITDRLPAAVMRAGLVLRDLGIVFDDVATRRGLLHGDRVQAGTEEDQETWRRQLVSWLMASVTAWSRRCQWIAVRCAAHDSPRPLAHAPRSACRPSIACSSCRRRRSARSIAAWSSSGAPVFTVDGRYTARGWTEWTEGFVYGAALLQFDATGERAFLDLGQAAHAVADVAAPHARRRARSRLQQRQHLRQPVAAGARTAHRRRRRGAIHFYELALKVSGAVQARRWTRLPGGGFIHSFNGAHSLFVDTIRSLRALALSHQLGHRLSDEQDVQVNLLERLVQHARATAQFSVYFGTGRDTYDVRGRVAHESLFNAANGTYRGPNSQQGYSPFSTWTRGLAWAMLGFAEQIEFLETLERRADRRRIARRGRRVDARCGARDVRLLHRSRRVRRRHSLLGHRRARTVGDARTGAIVTPIRSTTTSRWTAPRRRSPRKGCCGSATCSIAGARTASATRRPDCACSTRCSTPRARISVSRRSPGTDPACDLSPAQRLGPRAEGFEDSPRRVVPVGRLSRARSGVVREATGDRRAVSHLLRR